MEHAAASGHPLDGTVAIAHLAALRIAVRQAGTPGKHVGHSLKPAVRVGWEAFGHDHGGEDGAQEVKGSE
jgi:hypothetical protein